MLLFWHCQCNVVSYKIIFLLKKTIITKYAEWDLVDDSRPAFTTATASKLTTQVLYGTGPLRWAQQLPLIVCANEFSACPPMRFGVLHIVDEIHICFTL